MPGAAIEDALRWLLAVVAERGSYQSEMGSHEPAEPSGTARHP
jgi:hypothetical protein